LIAGAPAVVVASLMVFCLSVSGVIAGVHVHSGHGRRRVRAMIGTLEIPVPHRQMEEQEHHHECERALHERKV
jgi:hypothetical protein